MVESSERESKHIPAHHALGLKASCILRFTVDVPPNFDYVYEGWSDTNLFEEKGIPFLQLSNDERRIVKVVDRYESTDRRYATFDEIAEETKLGDYIFAQFLLDLTQKKGILIEVLPRCYRSIHRD